MGVLIPPKQRRRADPLKVLAQKFGCAKKGSPLEKVARKALVDAIREEIGPVANGWTASVSPCRRATDVRPR